MKKLIIIAIIVGLSYWVGQNQEKVRISWNAFESKAQNLFDRRSEAPADGSVDIATTSTGPLAVTSSPPVTSRLSRELPEGVYYTRERITEVTDAGVRSIMAGARVQKISNTSGKVLVDDGNVKLVADERSLTRDTEEVSKLLQSIRQ